MPGMGGEEFLRRLLQMEESVRFLVMTGGSKTIPDDWACLRKPFSVQDLIDEIVLQLTV